MGNSLQSRRHQRVRLSADNSAIAFSPLKAVSARTDARAPFEFESALERESNFQSSEGPD